MQSHVSNLNEGSNPVNTRSPIKASNKSHYIWNRNRFSIITHAKNNQNDLTVFFLDWKMKMNPGNICWKPCGQAYLEAYISTGPSSHHLRRLTGPPIKGAPMMPPGIIIMPDLTMLAMLMRPFSKWATKKTLTVQGINISHLGKWKIIFKMPVLGDMFPGGYYFPVYWLFNRDQGSLYWLVVIPIYLGSIITKPTRVFFIAQMAPHLG